MEHYTFNSCGAPRTILIKRNVLTNERIPNGDRPLGPRKVTGFRPISPTPTSSPKEADYVLTPEDELQISPKPRQTVTEAKFNSSFLSLFRKFCKEIFILLCNLLLHF